MSARLDSLARDKELLVMRSALCRLRLRRESYQLRASLHWTRAAAAAATAPALRRIAFGLVLSFFGPGRAARVVLFAGRVLVIATLARSAIDYARKLSASRSRAVVPLEDRA
jgi:hypothetical protein